MGTFLADNTINNRAKNLHKTKYIGNDSILIQYKDKFLIIANNHFWDVCKWGMLLIAILQYLMIIHSNENASSKWFPLIVNTKVGD